MNAKSFIKVSLFGCSVIAGNIGSAFGWKCSKGEEHKRDEACSRSPFERPCNNPMCGSDYHLIGKVCPQDVFAFQAKSIKYVILPYCVPEGIIADLWLQYGCSNVRRDENFKEYCPKIAPKPNIEIQRLESRVEKLKEKFPEELGENEEKRQQRLKMINRFIEQGKMKRKPISSEELKWDKRLEEKIKEKIKEQEEKRKKACLEEGKIAAGKGEKDEK